jgi:predicted DNA-binding antitoxin AbrB/MazE fold protein
MLRTIEAVYENGMLRPLEPIEPQSDRIYLVTILDADTVQRRTKQHASDLRGKYRGYLSTSEEFAHSKANEKALER